MLSADAVEHRRIANIERATLPDIQRNVADLAARRRAARSRLQIKIARVLTRSTLASAGEFIRLGIELGADRVVFHNLIFASISDYELAECLFMSRDTVAIFDDLQREYGERIAIEFPTLLAD